MNASDLTHLCSKQFEINFSIQRSNARIVIGSLLILPSKYVK